MRPLTVQVAKRRDPAAVLTVDRYGSGDDSPPAPPRPPLDAPRLPAAQNAVLPNGVNKSSVAVPPVPRPQDAPRLPTQTGVSANGENKSTVAAPPSSTAKVATPPDSGTILPARIKVPPSSGPNFVSSAPSAPPRSNTTVSDVVESAEKMMGADIVEKGLKPKTLSPPAPAVDDLWDFKKYIGFEEPAEVKGGGWAVADGEQHQNHDAGPLAGENVMNVIVVSDRKSVV